MATETDRVDALRKELHQVDGRLIRVELELKNHREQSALQHDAVMTAVGKLRTDLSDQGRTPPPPPTVDPPSDPGALTISPKRVAPWLKLLLPYLLTGGIGAAATQAINYATSSEPDAATEAAP